MSNRIIEVTPEYLETVAAQIESTAEDYKAQYDLLYTEMDAMASTWSGKDNQAYITRIKGFQEDFANMKRLMDDYARFLRVSAKTYRDTQNAIASRASKLQN